MALYGLLVKHRPRKHAHLSAHRATHPDGHFDVRIIANGHRELKICVFITLNQKYDQLFVILEGWEHFNWKARVLNRAAKCFWKKTSKFQFLTRSNALKFITNSKKGIVFQEWAN